MPIPLGGEGVQINIETSLEAVGCQVVLMLINQLKIATVVPLYLKPESKMTLAE